MNSFDLRELFEGVVEEYFFCRFSYQRLCLDDTLPQARRDYYRRLCLAARRNLDEECLRLGIDEGRLISLHRMLFHWEKLRGWRERFPFQTHRDAILSYLTPEEPQVERMCA